MSAMHSTLNHPTLNLTRTENTNESEVKPMMSSSTSSSTSSSMSSSSFIPASHFVSCLQFSPFVSSHDLMAFESNGRLSVVRIIFTESNDFVENIECNQMNAENVACNQMNYELIQDFVIGMRCSSVAFSPQTDFSTLEKCIKIAVASHDNNIRLITSQVKENKDVVWTHFRDHESFINEISFDAQNGDTLASVSDDCSCCLWSCADGKLFTRLKLTSPGVSIKWHPNEPNKLFVAEKKGVIRFYNLETKHALMSFDCNKFPLLCADWCLTDSLLIACIAVNEMFFWNTSLSSLPIEKRRSHPQGGQKFQFYDNNIIATRGRPNNCVQVQNLKNNQVLLDVTLKAGDGLSWNCKYPILAAGGSKAVHLYRFNSLL